MKDSVPTEDIFITSPHSEAVNAVSTWEHTLSNPSTPSMTYFLVQLKTADVPEVSDITMTVNGLAYVEIYFADHTTPASSPLYSVSRQILVFFIHFLFPDTGMVQVQT